MLQAYVILFNTIYYAMEDWLNTIGLTMNWGF